MTTPTTTSACRGCSRPSPCAVARCRSRLRAAGADRPVPGAAPDFREAHLPARAEGLRPGDELVRDDYRLVTFPVAHGVSAVGYALDEDARPGRFDVQAADALGVPWAGARRAAAGRGCDTCRRPDDHARQGARPAAAGRKIVIAGDGGPAESVIEASREPKVVHEATFWRTSAIARAKRGIRPRSRRQAWLVPPNVRLLVLTHLLNCYFGGEVVREVKTVFPAAVVPKDFHTSSCHSPSQASRLVKAGALHRLETPEEAPR